jgi:predicted enzyme related to lactoylglutathione lyase
LPVAPWWYEIRTAANAPSFSFVYFGVNNCDATAKKVTSPGGEIAMPPTDIPNAGRFSI